MMYNKNMENAEKTDMVKQQLLLMKYNTKNTLNENREVILNEQVSTAVKDLLASEKTALKNLMPELQQVKDFKGLKNVDAILSRISRNPTAATEFWKTLNKSSKLTPRLKQLTVDTLLESPKFLEKYGKNISNYNRDALRAELKSSGKYSDDVINQITANLNNKGIRQKVKNIIKGDTSTFKATAEGEQALAKESWMQRQKDKLANLYDNGRGVINNTKKNKWIKTGFLKSNGRISKRKLLAWAAAIGVSYYVLKSWLSDNGIQEDVLTNEEKEKRAKKCGYNNWEEYKAKGFACPATTTDTTTIQGGGNRATYTNCTGTYTIGCKSEVIKKVQGCLGGIKSDGLFGPQTKGALLAKTGKDSFTDGDVNTICQPTTPVTTTATTVNQQQVAEPAPVNQQQATTPVNQQQTTTPKFTKEPIFGATTLETACGDERVNSRFRACRRKFNRIVRISNAEMNESTKPLNLVIRESLLNKKYTNENFGNFNHILTESNENIIEDFLIEGRRLYENGIINEQNMFQNMFSSMFGNAGEGVMQYFKVKLAKWVLTELKIADENSFLGNVIANVFAEINFTDYPKIFTDCNFTTKKIAEGIADGAAEYFLNQKGYSGPLSGVVLQSASESLFSTEFIRSLEQKLVGVICPILKKAKSAIMGN